MNRVEYRQVSGMLLVSLFALVPCVLGASPFAVEVPLSADGVQRTMIEAASYSFTPSHLVVRAGKPVELTFKSVSWLTPHNIIIDDPRSGLSVRQELSAGENVTIKFTPAVTGSFAIYCDEKLLFFKSHREKGMEGVLEVR